ncbi:signal peptidase I [SAR202 cluster bacterium AC-647-N09_OGT_505m]|nr:signal peptidase I [SAR202 cluster bacterium AC-647-N09_OGT_505m]
MKDFLSDLLETVALALLVFLALQTSVRNYRVELSSMESTLFPKDRLVVNKLVYFHLDTETIDRLIPFVDIWEDDETLFPFHSPRRGEVIVFHFPNDPSRDFVKRVIAVPGEEVSMTDGRVFIDGNRLSEPYLLESNNDNLAPILVPPDSYFVMGDNRDHSSDSRYWGPVPLDNVVGKVSLRYWPFSTFSLLSVESQGIVDADSIENPS